MSGHRVLSSTQPNDLLLFALREMPHHVSLSVSFFSGFLTICCLLEMLKTSLSDPVIIIPRVLLEENHSHCWTEPNLGGAAGSYALP